MLYRMRFVLAVCVVLGLVMFPSLGLAFDITYCGPYMGSADIVAGDSLTSQVTTDEPYWYVDWYVDGSYQSRSCGNGSTQSAYFTHSFSNGSTSGQQHTVKACAFDWDSSSNEEDSYSVTVWSDMEDVSSPSRSVSNEMEVNGSYSISFSMSTPSSSYAITRAEIWVDGSLVSSQNYSDAGSINISASGSLGSGVGQAVPVVAKIKWRVRFTGILKTANYAWNAVVRCKVYGTCTCATDSNYLDSGSFHYGNNQYVNTTGITWNAASGGQDSAVTSNVGGTHSRTYPVDITSR